MKAIFRKELRDLLPWVPLGIILIGVLCWYVAPRDAYNRGGSIEFSLSGLVGGGNRCKRTCRRGQARRSECAGS